MNTPRKVLLAQGVQLKTSIFDYGIDGKRKSSDLAMGGRLDFEVPKDCDLIVLMGNKGGGYVPYRCLLPHQVYLDDIEKDFEKKNFEVIYAAPVKSKMPFQIAYADDYDRQRWENR